jgi:putative transposase
MVGKRHASDEISAKLAHANELAAKGKTQREISKALGVSIMTYHRWKKMLKSESSGGHGGVTEGALSAAVSDGNSEETIKRLELQNAQLRRLLTDALLEKLNYEEELRARPGARMRRRDKG